MRFLAQIPVEVGNAKAKDGRLGRDMQRIVEAQKPEAAYFIEEGGVRTAVLAIKTTRRSCRGLPSRGSWRSTRGSPKIWPRPSRPSTRPVKDFG